MPELGHVSKGLSGGVMPLCFVYFDILWYIRSFHYIHTVHPSVAIRGGSSPSPHRWSAHWEKDDKTIKT